MSLEVCLLTPALPSGGGGHTVHLTALPEPQKVIVPLHTSPTFMEHLLHAKGSYVAPFVFLG